MAFQLPPNLKAILQGRNYGQLPPDSIATNIPGVTDTGLEADPNQTFGALQGMVRAQGDAPVVERQGMDKKQTLTAMGLTLLLNLIDKQHRAGGDFAQGFTHAAQQKNEQDYQNALAKAEQTKQKNQAEMQALEMQYQKEQQDRNEKLGLIKAAASAKLEALQAEQKFQREQRAPLSLSERQKLELTQTGQQALEELRQKGKADPAVTKAYDRLTDPSTDPKDKMGALFIINQALRDDLKPPLRPEDFNLDPSYKVLNTQAQTGLTQARTTSEILFRDTRLEGLKTANKIADKSLGFMDENHRLAVAQSRATYAATTALAERRKKGQSDEGGGSSWTPEDDKVYMRGLQIGVREGTDARDKIGARGRYLAEIRGDLKKRITEKDGKFTANNQDSQTAMLDDGKEYTYTQLNNMVRASNSEFSVQQEIVRKLKSEQAGYGIGVKPNPTAPVAPLSGPIRSIKDKRTGATMTLGGG